MEHKKYIRETQDKINELLDDIELLQHKLDKAEELNKTLLAEIDKIRQTTARECLGGDISKGMDSDLPPEKRPPLKAAKKRIKAATDLYDKNFDNMGNPTTELGNKLSNRYRY